MVIDSGRLPRLARLAKGLDENLRTDTRQYRVGAPAGTCHQRALTQSFPPVSELSIMHSIRFLTIHSCKVLLVDVRHPLPPKEFTEHGQSQSLALVFNIK
jgi:hypothetical protein